MVKCEAYNFFGRPCEGRVYGHFRLCGEPLIRLCREHFEGARKALAVDEDCEEIISGKKFRYWRRVKPHP